MTSRSTKALLFVLLSLVFGPKSYARISNDWIESPAQAPNLRFLIHQSSERDEPSYFSIQSTRKNDAKTGALFSDLKSKALRDEDLSPLECYPLERASLKTSQTWCKDSSGALFVIVEGGKHRLKENEKVEYVLGVLK